MEVEKRRKTGGRQKGTPNKATRAWKDFVVSLCEKESAQAAVELAIEGGRADLLFKAAEHAFGKPTQRIEQKSEFKMIGWPDDEDVSEE